MKHILTIARRELSAMFRAPLAYVFLVLFIVVAQLPHSLTVFAQGQADARLFYDFMPWCIVVFSALVTMRSWAEERQDNTYEMLLTFPMKDHHLVLGKWLSAFAFLALGIVCTATVPIMLFAIGRPDPGPIFAGYLGAFGLAALSTAAGVFFSGLTRSQLLAALLSLVFGFLSLLVGTEMVATLIDAPFGGVGRAARSMIGAWSHYAVFTRGVIELYDVFFFAAWTIVFLHLNTLFLGLRRISDSLPQMIGASVLGLGCGMLTSRLVSEGSFARLDLTEDKLYTLSPGTLAILAQARVPVQVRYYVSPSEAMPSQIKSLEREVVDRLHEMEVASHGKLQFSVLHMNIENLVVTPEEEAVAEGEDENELSLAGDEKKPPKDEKKAAEAKKSLEQKEKSVEKRLLEKGVKPFTVESYEATQTSSKLIYSTLGIAYREKDEEFIPQVVPQKLSEMEYMLANTIAKITRPRPPKIALITGEEPMDPQIRAFYQQQGQKIPDPYSGIDEVLRKEKFEVQKVNLSAQQPMPDDYDALAVIGTTNLDARQRWEIGRALCEGRPTLIALQRLSWQYQQQGRSIQVRPSEFETGLDDLLTANGLGLSRQVLMDASSRTLGLGVFINLPMHVFVTRESMNPDSPITRRLGSIHYLWGNSLDIDKAKLASGDMKQTLLMSSSEKAWLVPVPSPGLRQQEISPDGKELKPRPLAVLVEGQFKDPEQDKPRPKWTPRMELDPRGRPIPSMPDGPEKPVSPGKGKLILTGCARMWSDWFVPSPGVGNTAFLLNSLDALTLDENLVAVRSKQPTDRSFEKPSPTTAVMWTTITLALVPLFVIFVGVGIAVLRFRRRESWNSTHGRWRS